ncbi:transcription repressor OFP17-like [Quillaja saponaria]|uniref:Transcription repressor OFP17-like n=1 Tax=Quillaja saponaria TaxID=32244 RepID=A0AAD7LU95_QUISA|nr:transcription repressor OFP17-like [Quillaja saponaria]
MKVKPSVTFRSKFFNPCRKLFQIFKFKLKKPVFIRALQVHNQKTKAGNASPKKRITTLQSVFRSLRKSKGIEKVMELKSPFNGGHEAEQLIFPSPLTPAYMRASISSKSQASGQEDVEEACRSFENYLVEMIIEEGKVRDLIDVEELLYYWKNLKCPVFTGLVCQFYGELCKDLFSSDGKKVDSPK